MRPGRTRPQSLAPAVCSASSCASTACCGRTRTGQRARCRTSWATLPSRPRTPADAAGADDDLLGAAVTGDAADGLGGRALDDVGLPVDGPQRRARLLQVVHHRARRLEGAVEEVLEVRRADVLGRHVVRVDDDQLPVAPDAARGQVHRRPRGWAPVVADDDGGHLRSSRCGGSPCSQRPPPSAGIGTVPAPVRMDLLSAPAGRRPCPGGPVRAGSRHGPRRRRDRRPLRPRRAHPGAARDRARRGRADGARRRDRLRRGRVERGPPGRVGGGPGGRPLPAAPPRRRGGLRLRGRTRRAQALPAPARAAPVAGAGRPRRRPRRGRAVTAAAVARADRRPAVRAGRHGDPRPGARRPGRASRRSSWPCSAASPAARASAPRWGRDPPPRPASTSR